jgi:carbon-monoxide dehydrogenase medium subunit
MGLPQFSYHCPQTLAELEGLLDHFQGQARILAGGTDLMVQMKAGIIAPKALLDIGRMAALQGVSYQPGRGFIILAGTKIAALEHSPVIREKLPALFESVGLLGSSQVRSMATLGGNACNASPSAETPPILIALGTEITVGGKNGERTMPLESFFRGYRQLDLKTGEYLKSFFIPEQPPGTGSAYLCRMLRGAMEIDMVNVGVRLMKDGRGCCQEACLALGAVAPVPFRARQAEEVLAGQPLSDETFRLAGEAAAGEAAPIDDIRSSADYRREMIRVMVFRALKTAQSRIKSD